MTTTTKTVHNPSTCKNEEWPAIEAPDGRKFAYREGDAVGRARAEKHAKEWARKHPVPAKRVEQVEQPEKPERGKK